MSAAPPPVGTVELRDGSSVLIRPIEPGDKEALAAAFDRLSPESRYRRFLVPMRRLTSSMLRYLTEVDHRDHEALVAIDPATGDGLGVARYVRERPGSRSAEAAVAVADDWQGRGLGTALLERLARRAREEGVERFTASVLAENREMLDLLRRLGGLEVVGGAQGAVDVVSELPRVGAGHDLRGLLRAAARGTLRFIGEHRRPHRAERDAGPAGGVLKRGRR